ncbi:sigma 54-interacting transcriptional regulator [Synechococcus sp. PCC 7336]|uniref:sigma 54-interacting transcriptional regulator n=1 Tax=Synechococcus sp. PCC 7336 TaxID=195250 RepID=UPI00034CD6F9|nr:sigma 54-interacting transcriptional regulator [Synechococcus sp. PCC 7336]
MEISDRAAWLQQNTIFKPLSLEVLEAIASAMQEREIRENRRIVLEGTLPGALYILRQGRVESYRSGTTGPTQAMSCLPGSVLYLQELLLEQPAERTAIALSDCHFWLVPQSDFAAIAQQYPEIAQTLSRQLAAQLQDVASQLEYEQKRQEALLPYRVTKARRGVVGSSRYAVRIRQAIRTAAGDRAPVVIFGEPGLGKDIVAALIHFSSSSRREPMIQLDCNLLQASGSELFGKLGGKPGLIEWLGRGTLLLNNLHELPPTLYDKIGRLLESGTYQPVSREGEWPAPLRTSQARIVATAERTLSQLDFKRLAEHFIQLPPVRVRKADIEQMVNYTISLFSRSQKVPRPQISPEALRQLQGYDFPGNFTELESAISRAIAQSNGAAVLTEETFWGTTNRNDRFRWNLLNAYPQLRQFLRSPWWPDRINYWVVAPLFALVVTLLFLGPQTRDRNIGLNLFWAWWWPLILIAFPFVGRLWCSICPFMIYGEIVQKLSLWLWPRPLARWPRQQMDRYGGWFLFALFAAIYLWEELWDLENTAYLSSWLLLLITGGAIVCSAIFERRLWCRYLCPIGGMNGLFAKLSMTELRAQRGICSAECTTYQCYKGGPQKGEGQETEGCPLYSHPAQMEENKDCVLCMTCLKACPHRSVEFNLRPPGIELWTTHTARSPEVALLFLLFGGILLHRLPEIISQWQIPISFDRFWLHAALSVAVLLVPAAIALLAYAATMAIGSKGKLQPFTSLAYGYLPLVLGGTLAHYWRLGLTEAGRILPVTMATFGASGTGLPAIVAHPAVIAFLQGTTLLAGAIASAIAIQKIARQPLTAMLPQHAAIVTMTSGFWPLIVGAGL